MKTGINLLKTSKETGLSSRYQSFIRIGGIVLILGYLLVLGVVFSIYFALSLQEKNLLSKISQQEKGIRDHEKIETLQLTLKNRAEALSWIFSREENTIGIPESLQRIRNLTGDKVFIDSLELSNFGNEISLRATTKQVPDLVDFINRLMLAKKDKGGFDNVSLSSLTRDSTGYQFSLTLQI